MASDLLMRLETSDMHMDLPVLFIFCSLLLSYILCELATVETCLQIKSTRCCDILTQNNPDALKRVNLHKLCACW
jgi:hypothetical protein